MKNIVGFSIAFVLLLLVACAPAAPPAAPAAPAAPAVQPAAPAQPSSEVAPTPVEAKPTPTVSKEMQELLNRADQKLKSYKYLELILPDKKQPDTMSVKGSKIKVELYEYDPYVPENYFDTIYLDTATKTIVGRCVERKRCIWPRGDNTKRVWSDLNYDQYRPKTPYEMLKMIPASARILGPEVHDNRQTTKLEYDDAGKLVTVWIDDNYGIPIEVSILTSDGKETLHKFNDMQFNSVTDADVTPPQ